MHPVEQNYGLGERRAAALPPVADVNFGGRQPARDPPALAR
jgi:hypothetical protein